MPLPRALHHHWRGALAALVLGVPCVALFAGAPIAQDPAYHGFAGDAAGTPVPNLHNVASNLAFLLAGLAGLAVCRARPTGAQCAWAVFFLGTALVSIGSAYYHWAPSDATLVWDRLPMTFAFMALLVALLAEQIDERLERALLVPAALVGVSSVAWWGWTGDLRFYIGVQVIALLAIPVLLLLYRARYTERAWLVAGLVLYAAAKLAEVFDREVFAWTGRVVAGHPLKHLLAALASLCVAAMLARRRGVSI